MAATEDNVLGLPGAKCVLPLLTQHPAHRVGHVRLAAPVRPYDPGDPRLEREDGTVEAALKTLDFEAGQTRSAEEGLSVGHRGGGPGNAAGGGTAWAWQAQ